MESYNENSGIPRFENPRVREMVLLRPTGRITNMNLNFYLL